MSMFTTSKPFCTPEEPLQEHSDAGAVLPLAPTKPPACLAHPTPAAVLTLPYPGTLCMVLRAAGMALSRFVEPLLEAEPMLAKIS